MKVQKTGVVDFRARGLSETPLSTVAYFATNFAKYRLGTVHTTNTKWSDFYREQQFNEPRASQ